MAIIIMPGPRTTLVLRKRYPNQNPNSNRRGAYPNPRGVYPNPRGVYPNPRGCTLTLKMKKRLRSKRVGLFSEHDIYINIRI